MWATSSGWFRVEKVMDWVLLLTVPIVWLIAEPAIAAVTR